MDSKRDTKRKIFAALILMIGLSMFSQYLEATFLFVGTDATVVQSLQYRGKKGYYYINTYSFVDESGKTRESQSRMSTKDHIEPGTKMTIYYNPRRPWDVQEEIGTNTLIMPMIMMAIGTLLLLHKSKILMRFIKK